jgi:hypothetical protein
VWNQTEACLPRKLNREVITELIDKIVVHEPKPRDNKQTSHASRRLRKREKSEERKEKRKGISINFALQSIL